MLCSLSQWANMYGGVYRIVMGGNTFVISDAKLANEILNARGDSKFYKAAQVCRSEVCVCVCARCF